MNARTARTPSRVSARTAAMAGDTGRTRIWLPGSLALLAAFAALPFGPVANQLAFVILVAAIAYALILDRVVVDDVLVWLTLLVAAWWALGFLNPNVQDLGAGVIGYRGFIAFFLGLSLGAVWVRGVRQALSAAWFLILLATVASIVLYFVFPAYESEIARAGGQYTDVFMGQRRMQGVFAGPFHTAVAGSFLALSSLRIRSIVPFSGVRVFGCLVGVATVYLSRVRTGIVAVVLGAVVLFVFARGAKSVIPRTGVICCVLAVIAVSWDSVSSALARTPILEPLVTFSDDNRLLDRTDSWRTAVEMILDRPFLGWGPGSAGATLQNAFAPGGHVTSHNLFLKYAVEGGLLGLLAVVAILLTVVVRILRTRDESGMALPAVLCIAVFGVVGSTLDTLPVSFAIAVALGLATSAKVDRIGLRNDDAAVAGGAGNGVTTALIVLGTAALSVVLSLVLYRSLSSGRFYWLYREPTWMSKTA